MNELIAIKKPTVSGRDLHAALGVETRYNNWFSRMCEYGFTEGRDFQTFLTGSTGGRPSTNHLISIPMAKEICMLQRSGRGKQFRQHFISVEEARNDPDAVIERAERILRKRMEAAERRIFGLLEEKENCARLIAEIEKAKALERKPDGQSLGGATAGKTTEGQ